MERSYNSFDHDNLRMDHIIVWPFMNNLVNGESKNVAILTIFTKFQFWVASKHRTMYTGVGKHLLKRCN